MEVRSIDNPSEMFEIAQENFTYSDLNVSLWLLGEGTNGPVVGVFLMLEFICSFIFNSFIVVYGLIHFKEDLKQSSTFLLFVLAGTNLIVTILYMPFAMVAFMAEEWIFGSTDNTRTIFCQIEGFILMYFSSASVNTLAVISIDRCLNIVRVNYNRKPKSWRIAFAAIVFLWVLSALFWLSPFYVPGLGRYGWSHLVGTCLATSTGYENYGIGQICHACIPMSIIVLTSAWIFLFTHGFIKKKLKRQESMHSIKSLSMSPRHKYVFQMKKVIGIFSALLLFNFLSWLPFIVVSIVGTIVDFEEIPNPVYSGTLVLVLFSNVSNPVIHIFFRKDLLNVFRKKVALKKSSSITSMRLQKSGIIITSQK